MDTKERGAPALGPAGRLRDFFIRFGDDRSGVAAVFFAVVLLLLIPLTLGLVNVYLATSERSKLQDALDAASLYVARTNLTDPDKITELGTKILNANMGADKSRLHGVTFRLNEKSAIVADAQMTASNVVPNPFSSGNLGAHSEVTRNSVNLEVAIVLDTTGSMSNSMTSLKSAAKELVNLVVKDAQTPYYSRAALVPYSVGVNAGAYANTVRGALRQPVTISGVTRANPAVVTTSANHGLKNGEKVYIAEVSGMVSNSDSSKKLNGREYTVKKLTDTTFSIDLDTTNYSKYKNSGRTFCVAEDCQLFSFNNAGGGTSRRWGTTCVTERTGNQAYTDASPATALLGRHRAGGIDGDSPASNMGCKSASVIPLTHTKKTLTDQIDTLVSDGSTAGQIGLAWGWYMVSSNWNSVWTGADPASAYGEPETVKVVVLMTDGAFNTNYYHGVSSSDSFGGSSDRIDQPATNGNAFDQAESLCGEMKKKGIVLYTVGFNIGKDKDVTDLLSKCASKPENVYLPASGTALTDAFKAIGQDINRLRISK